MAYRVEILPPALADVEEAWAWMHARSPTRAARWRNGLLEALQSLATFPERCGLAPENDIFDEEIRQLLYGKRRGVYRVLFTIRGDVVTVLHVRHGARRFLGP